MNDSLPVLLNTLVIKATIPSIQPAKENAIINLKAVFVIVNLNLSINSLNFPLFSRLPAIENSIYVSFSLVFALMG